MGFLIFMGLVLVAGWIVYRIKAEKPVLPSRRGGGGSSSGRDRPEDRIDVGKD